MTTPTGGESNVIDAIIDFAQHYLPLPITAMLIGLLWRGSARIAQYEQTQAEHAEKLKEHAIDIAALREAGATNREIVAALPTKHDLHAQTVQLQSQMQSGFETITRIISRRD